MLLIALAVVIVAVYFVMCFTWVKEGTSKQVVRFGAYRKTLLTKKGYKLDRNGDLVKIPPEEEPWWPSIVGGLHWVSLVYPIGIDAIYTRTMKYVKAVDKKFELKADEKTDFLLTGTQYQYGLEFSDAEDRNNLPLSGKMTMTAMIINPYKALFIVREWFDVLVGRVLPRVRQYISEHDYDQLINEPAVQLDQDVFKMLNAPDPTDEPPQGRPKRSIIQILREMYGIELIALETVSIEPPPDYRGVTLAKWKAAQIADKETEETAGRILKSVAKSANITTDELKQRLTENPALRGISNSQGGFLEDFVFARDLVKRDRAGVKDVRVGNTDGTSLDPLTGWAAALLGLARGGGEPSSSTSKGQREGGKGKKKSLRDLSNATRGKSPEEVARILEENAEQEEEDEEDKK